MPSKSDFYLPLTFHKDSASGPLVAPFVDALPLLQAITDQVVVLRNDVGGQVQGLYAFDGQQRWQFVMPMVAVSIAIINGDTLDVYTNPTLDVSLPVDCIVYKNGQLQASDFIVHGSAVYAVRTPNAGGGGGGGTGPQGPQGPQGPAGQSFVIARTYATLAALQADTAPTGINAGQFAVISSTDTDNGKLFMWTGSVYNFVVNMSTPANTNEGTF